MASGIYFGSFGTAAAVDNGAMASRVFGSRLRQIWMGSEEWIHDSQLIIREATEKKMGGSTTSGTNWAIANLITIRPDDKEASKEIDFFPMFLPRESVYEII